MKPRAPSRPAPADCFRSGCVRSAPYGFGVSLDGRQGFHACDRHREEAELVFSGRAYSGSDGSLAPEPERPAPRRRTTAQGALL